MVERILISLRDKKKNGILVIEADNGKYAVYLKEGEVVYIREIKKVLQVYLDRDFDCIIEKEKLKKEEVRPKSKNRLLDILRLKNIKRVFFTTGFIEYSPEIQPSISIKEVV